MTIGRRQAFGLSALGLGAVALEGCGGGPSFGPGATMSADDVDNLLSQLDQVAHHLAMLDSDPKKFGIQGSGPEVSQGRERCIGLLTTLCFMGTYREVPQSVWHEPRVAAHLAKSLPRIEGVITGARDHLTGMSEEMVAAIDERLLKDPDLPMHIMERIDGYAKEIHVPIEQRTYLRLTTAQLAARFRYEGTKEVTRKISSTYRRLLDSTIALIERDTDSFPDHWELARERGDAGQPTCDATRTHSNFFAAPRTDKRGDAGESCVQDDDCAPDLACKLGECAPSPQPKSKRLVRTAKQVAKVGAWFFLPPLCAIGVLIMTVCLFMVIVAGLVYAGGD